MDTVSMNNIVWVVSPEVKLVHKVPEREITYFFGDTDFIVVRYSTANKEVPSKTLLHICRVRWPRSVVRKWGNMCIVFGAICFC
jgi:hypothetical protein